MPTSPSPRLGLPSLAVGLLLLVGACADADPTSPGATLSVVTVDIPFHMRGTAALSGQTFAPGFGPPLFLKSTFGGRCSEPSDFVIGFDLWVDATALAVWSASAEHCTQIDFATGASTITDGRMVLVGASEELRTEYERLDPTPNAPEIHTFVGGTGRFDGASGEAEANPECDRQTGTCEIEMHGSLRFRPSGRARQGGRAPGG